MADRREQLRKTLDSESEKALEILNELEKNGQEKIADGVSNELTDARKRQIVSQIKADAVVADGKVKAFLVNAIPAIYVSSLNYTDTLLKKWNINVGATKATVELMRTVQDLSPHLAATNALMSDAYLDFGTGITGWVKGNEHILNDVLRRQLQAKIADGRLSGESVREIKKSIVSALDERGIRSLIDRGGREWTLDRYGEMLTRTHLIRANTEASVLRMQEFEIDIVEVSDHNTEDELCNRYEGNIYSLSGKSKKYPYLDLRPPFHPNCKHTLLPRPDLE